jgi:hypothetical protein
MNVLNSARLGRLGFEEALDDFAHALQRGERHHHNALGGHRAVEHLGVAVGRRFFVAPDDVLAGAFKALSALLVGLQAQQAHAAGHVLA